MTSRTRSLTCAALALLLLALILPARSTTMVRAAQAARVRPFRQQVIAR